MPAKSQAEAAHTLEEIIDLAGEMPPSVSRGSTKAPYIAGARGSRKEIAAAMGVHPTTVTRKLKKVVKELARTNPEGLLEARLQQRAIFELMEEALVSGKIEPDVARAWQSIRDSISRLMGYDAPSKSQSVHVNVEATVPPAYDFYDRVCFEFKGVPRDRWEEAFLAVRAVLQPFKAAQKNIKDEVAEICQKFLPPAPENTEKPE